MNDLPTVKIAQTVKNAFSHLSQDFFSSSTAQFPDLTIDAIQTASFTELHGDGDRTRRFVHKCTVIPANVLRCAIFVEVELPYDLFLDVGVGISCDNLLRKYEFMSY